MKMELKSKKWVSISLMAGIILIALVLLNGCNKSEPGTKEPAATEMKQEMSQQKTEAEDQTMQVASATEQTLCPVMGEPIDKNIFVEYEGKKVYFCCKGCETKFNENPELYIAKLPQFKQ
jgi:YHS domain-containing protein